MKIYLYIIPLFFISCRSYYVPAIEREILPSTSFDAHSSYSEVGFDSSRKYFIGTISRSCAEIPSIIVKQYTEGNKVIRLKYDVKYRSTTLFRHPEADSSEIRPKEGVNYKISTSPDKDGFNEIIIYNDVKTPYRLYTCVPQIHDGKRECRVINTEKHTGKLRARKNSNQYLVLYNPEMAYGTIYSMADIYTYYKDKEYLIINID